MLLCGACADHTAPFQVNAGPSPRCPSAQPWPVFCINSRPSPLTPLTLPDNVPVWITPTFSLPQFLMSLQKPGFCLGPALTSDPSQIRWVAFQTQQQIEYRVWPLLGHCVIHHLNEDTSSELCRESFICWTSANLNGYADEVQYSIKQMIRTLKR